MSAKQNKHTTLMTMSPIEYRRNDPDDRIAKLRKYLAKRSALHNQDRVFCQCPMLHMARLQIIDNILPPMGDKPAERLKSSYLFFVADIDGEVDDFLDALYNGPQRPFSWVEGDADGKRHSNFVHKTWGRCIGYPDETGAVFFRRYIHRCRIKVSLPYAAYAHSVGEIKEAKHRQACFARFVIETQGMDADSLFAAWQDFRDAESAAVADGALSYASQEDNAESKPRQDGERGDIPQSARTVAEPPHADRS